MQKIFCKDTHFCPIFRIFALIIKNDYDRTVRNHVNWRVKMAYIERFGQSDDYRREELIRIIEHSVEKLTLQELEALYYDMSTKNYINSEY